MNNNEYSTLVKDDNTIDIIIPVYNSVTYLSNALDSIEKQTYKNLMVYIIDDASSDDYQELLKKYNNLKIVYHKLNTNNGPGIARQVGIELSQSKYIVFLDSDDIFADENSVKILYDAIQGYDVVTSKIQEETMNGKVYWINDNIGLHGKIYRRSFLENNEIKFPNSRLNEDTFFNSLLVLFNAHYNNINTLTYIWRYNTNSITRKDNNNHINNDRITYCVMVDDGNITINENTIIGPNVTICTSNHSLDVMERVKGWIYIQDVNIGKNVWIGAGTIILPGVSIGDNSVIGAGSVVTKSIPKNVLAFGNPCTIQ